MAVLLFANRIGEVMQSVAVVSEEATVAEGHEALASPAEESRSIGTTDWPDIVQGLGYLVAE